MTGDQERLLRAFVEYRWDRGVKVDLIGRSVTLGSDYVDFVLGELCKEGCLQSEGEGRDKLYCLTAKGKKALEKESSPNLSA